MARNEDSIETLDAEYLYPSDADILEISNDDGGRIRVRFAVPDPETGEGLVLDAVIERIEKGEFERPLDDERYE
ncbi:MAG: hypothetical protein ACQET5_11625 [Halobacteriota archaeon]